MHLISHLAVLAIGVVAACAIFYELGYDAARADFDLPRFNEGWQTCYISGARDCLRAPVWNDGPCSDDGPPEVLE